MSSWDSHVLYESDDLNMAMAKFREEVRAVGVAVDMSDTPDDSSAWRNIFRIELQKVIFDEDGGIIAVNDVKTSPFFDRRKLY